MARIAIDARKIRDFGIGSHIASLVAGLERVAPEDEFVLFLPPRAAPPVASPRFRVVRVRARGYGVAEHLTLPVLARRHRADLYHAPHYVLPWFLALPAVVTMHDLIHLRFPEYLPGRAALHYARTVMRRSFRRARRVLTVSEASKRDLLEWFGGPPGRVVVVPNAVEEAFFAPRGEEELARARERFGLEGRFVLYAGNVKPHKNLERLVEAFARLKQEAETRDLRLVLIGKDLAGDHGLRRLAAERRVAEHVRFLGWLPQDERCAVYRLATAFAYPSLYEGFGLPPLEAMASGVPVVASDRSALPEVCGDAAILVDPYDVDAIAAALRTAVVDSARRKELVGRGHERARAFRGDRQARLVHDVYRAALAGADA